MTLSLPPLRVLFAAASLSFVPLAAMTAAATAAPQPLDRIVTIVNSDVILQSEVDESLDEARKQLISRGITVPALDVLRQQVMERLVLVRLQTQRAQQAGIRIDDRELNDVIANVARQNGLTAQQFAEQLSGDGMDFQFVREQIREEVIISRLKQREVDSRVVITDQDIDLFLAAQGSDPDMEYQLSHILIALPDGASAEQRSSVRAEADQVLAELRAGGSFADLAASHSDGQQALSGGDLGWRRAEDLPEVFATTAATLGQGQISDLLTTPGGFHIIRLMDKRGGGPRETVVETRARHILIQPDAIVSEDAARADILSIHARILAGEDFAKLAQENSDDPGSKNAGGDLEWMPPGVLVPDFQKEVDALQPGQMSQPFRTQFGWHIVRVDDRRTRDTTDESRRARARSAIFQRKSAEEYDLWLRRLRDEAYVEYRGGTSGKS